MIVCPNCNHQNPEGAVQCEACYTPLPSLATCPNCGAKVQADASFCGQCGFNLQAASTPSRAPVVEPDEASVPTLAPDFSIPDLPPMEPLEPLMPLEPAATKATSSASAEPAPTSSASAAPEMSVTPDEETPETVAYESSAEPTSGSSGGGALGADAGVGFSAPVQPTQIQMQAAQLMHVQTDTMIELPPHLSVIHIGKPNDRIPPDVDVSGFPNSEIVSRIHADIRVEGNAFYIEDVGSSNGTYVNNLPLPKGNRHCLRGGDRISLGKGDKVTFLFQQR